MAENELYAAFQRINTIIFAQGLALGSEDYFTVRKLCVEGMKAAQEAGSPPADVVGDLLGALKALALAAEHRENTMGDVCRLLECKANLEAAAKAARAAIAKAEAAQLPGKGDAVDEGEVEDRGEVDEPGNEPEGVA